MTIAEIILTGIVAILFVLRGFDNDTLNLHLRSMQDQLNARQRDCADLYIQQREFTKAMVAMTDKVKQMEDNHDR